MRSEATIIVNALRSSVSYLTYSYHIINHVHENYKTIVGLNSD